jgi:hypothetical protein
MIVGRKQQGFVVAWLVAAFLAPGCSTGPQSAIVTGEVTLDGRPIENGRIAFQPLDGKSQSGGAEIKDGKFSAEVPLANMKVEINGNKQVGTYKPYDTPQSPVLPKLVEIVPSKYNVNSELTLDVKKGLPPQKFELKSK